MGDALHDRGSLPPNYGATWAGSGRQSANVRGRLYLRNDSALQYIVQFGSVQFIAVLGKRHSWCEKEFREKNLRPSTVLYTKFVYVSKRIG